MSGKTEFKIIPGRDELANIERDLRFHPASSANPAKLTLNHIESFNRDGFLKGLSVFDTNEITDIRAYFDGLLSQAFASGGDSYSISSAHLKHGRVYDILSDSRIVAYVKDLLGANVIGWGSHFFCKMPHDGKRVA